MSIAVVLWTGDQHSWLRLGRICLIFTCFWANHPVRFYGVFLGLGGQIFAPRSLEEYSTERVMIEAPVPLGQN